ncbi:methylesterase 7-like [Phragmites australis]|uniref:methylesterase 7-like n=1 Tax=Phragmites australis TaxID=29695 RepID=UPI002D7A0614|nr:methylesterase 7-like [Phragmites australis]
MNVAFAAEAFPEKVAAAVFVTAVLPDCANPCSHVFEQVHRLLRIFKQTDPKLSIWDLTDSVTDAEHVTLWYSSGPNSCGKISAWHKIYQLSPPEDYTLSQSLARASSFYVADLQRQAPFNETRYGAVSKMYVVCKQDLTTVEDYQRQMIAGCAVAEVREIADADHMVMFSTPAELAGHLNEIANTYA